MKKAYRHVESAELDSSIFANIRVECFEELPYYVEVGLIDGIGS